MQRIGRNFRFSKTYRRFALSFMIVFILPVIFFTFLYMQKYRKVYEDKIIEQAAYSLDAVKMELERDIEGFQAIVNYNSQLSHMQKAAILKDYRNSEVISSLSAEVATHSILEDINYYNYSKPDMIYTSKGTYSLKYYAMLCAGFTDARQLEDLLNGVSESGWIRWDETGKLGYVIKNKDNLWIFFISNERLNDIFDEEGSDTILMETDGKQLFPFEKELPDDMRTTDYKEICVESSYEQFKLVRSVDCDRLFEEVQMWEKFFFVMVVLILIVGFAVVMLLTSYNERPIKELYSYCRGKINDIPSSMGGLDAFRFTMKSMEEKIGLLEEKQKKNKLLLQLIYSNDNNSEEFKHLLDNMGIFQTAECYRVVVALAKDEQAEINSNNFRLYINMVARGEFEFRIVDTAVQNAIVMIVGMTEKVEGELETELLRVADIIKTNLYKDVYFFVGDKRTELDKIHESYLEAISCSRTAERNENVPVVFYKKIQSLKKGFIYPNLELNSLYDALVTVDFDKASMITDVLIEMLEEQKENRFVCISLYYDLLNTYYRAQLKLEISTETAFLDIDLSEVQDSIEVNQLIIQIREQFKEYINKVKDTKEDRHIISDVVLFIEENIENCDLSVSMIADYFNMSISNLSHQFKAQMNRNISDFITEKKFVYAAELLIETEYSVKKIAEIMGYSQTASFIRKFKQYYGLTPVEYRNMNKKA